MDDDAKAMAMLAYGMVSTLLEALATTAALHDIFLQALDEVRDSAISTHPELHSELERFAAMLQGRLFRHNGGESPR